MREGAHVARALDVVLAPQRIDADPAPSKVSGRQGEIGDRQHRGRALAVFGDAEAVVDGPVAALRVQPGGGAHLLGRHAGDRLDGLWAVLGARDELRPLVESLASRGHERRVGQALGHHHVRHRIDDRHVRSRLQLEVVIGLDMR